MKFSSIVSTFLIFTLIFTLNLESLDKARIKKAGLEVKKFMKKNSVSGIAVAYGEKGKILWSEGFGYADIEAGVEVDPGNTLFRIGSLSKPISAYAVMVLVEEGVLDLDADIRNYLPSYPEKKYSFTTRQLGGHLGGIRTYKGNEYMNQKPYENVEESLDIFKDDPLLSKPGTRFFYTNYGWNIISAVMEKITGEDFLSLMKKRVFKPLYMKSTVEDHYTPLIKNRSRKYSLHNGSVVNAPFVDNSYKWAAAGFLSTVEDMVRFGFEHLYPKKISKKSVKTLWMPQKTSDGKYTNYGIGWSAAKDSNQMIYYGHAGGAVGGSSRFRVYPARSAVFVIMSNMGRVPYGKLPDRLIGILIKDR